MSKILITGGAGFIGSHLTKALLTKRHSIRIFDNLSPQIHGHLPKRYDWLDAAEVEFIRASVTDVVQVRKALQGIDVLVHLASETGTGQSMYEISRYSEVNLGGTAVLLDALANDPNRSVSRIVLASSRSIYGEGAYACSKCDPNARVYPASRTRPQLEAYRWEHACKKCGNPLQAAATRETDPPQPGSIYAATKYAQEDLVRVAATALGIDFALLRLQNVYGEGQSLNNPYTGILSIFSTRIRRGLHLPIFEDGQETRDFVHVEDVANAFCRAIEFEGATNQAINVGMGIKTTVQQIATHLSNAFGVEPNLVTTNEFRLGDIRHNFADIQRLKNSLNFSPQITLAEGMKRFAHWVNTQVLPKDQLEQANRELKSRGLMGS